IPMLARHFLQQSAKQLGVEVKRMSEGAMQFLTGLDLPGNVRQLENLCNWITVMAPGQTVEAKDLPHELTEGQAYTAAPLAATSNATASISHAGVDEGAFSNGGQVNAMPVAMLEKSNWISLLETEAASLLAAGQPEVMDALGRQFESILIKTALKHTHGRKNDAAIRLGIGRNTITRKIHELGIDGAKDD
ncbi:MAG TPA: helix-turn-helix domain-containing protein, partial [Herminiimonas sp.]|nr:helix-turn-helix domain-containing protein [Herminiimonas sp.]